MNIELKKMRIINFKGIKMIEIDFQKETDIVGDNATGKTSIFDAFLWLLFGKDSTDSSKFNIKPLDKNNKPINKTENEVNVVLDIDGRTVNIKKVLREKWLKKRGEQLSVFEGNENLYFWNEVPMLEKDYTSKISDIVNPGIFRMLTNTLYFNQQMSWSDRRNVLMSIAGKITNEEIAAGNPEYASLVEALTQKTLTEYKSEISSKKRKLKEALAHIPSRVDEINRGLPEVLDWEEIYDDIKSKEAKIDSIDAEIANSTDAHEAKFEKIKAQLKAIHELTVKRDSIAYEIKAAESKKAGESATNVKLKRKEIEGANAQIKSSEDEIALLKKRKEDAENEMKALRERWAVVNAESIVFDEHDFNCPTCKRDFEADDIEVKKAEMTANFVKDKKRRLDGINDRGKSKKIEVENTERKIGELQEQVDTLTEHRVTLYAELKVMTDVSGLPAVSIESLIKDNVEYMALNDQIATLEAAKEEAPKTENTFLILQKNEIRNDIDLLRRRLATKDQIAKSKIRISELQQEEQGLSQQLADLEGMEFLIEKFTAAKIDMMEQRINGKFKLVRFKMFNYQVNGGVEECCETMINGVPFSDLNTAAKINAGIDIINVLCEHYNIHVPIFIDGRESVTKVIPCDSQIINLIVKEGLPLTIDGVKVSRNLKEMAA